MTYYDHQKADLYAIQQTIHLSTAILEVVVNYRREVGKAGSDQEGNLQNAEPKMAGEPSPYSTYLSYPLNLSFHKSLIKTRRTEV